MSIFDEAKNLAEKAQELAHEHPDQVKQALDKAEGLIDHSTGGKFTEQITKGGDTAEGFLTGEKPA